MPPYDTNQTRTTLERADYSAHQASLGRNPNPPHENPAQNDPQQNSNVERGDTGKTPSSVEENPGGQMTGSGKSRSSDFYSENP